MRKLLVPLLVMILAACGTSNHPGDVNSSMNDFTISTTEMEVTKGDFIYRLVSEHEEYQAGGPVKIYAELEYIGDQEKIEIFHAMSPFHFPMVEKTRDYTIGYGMEEPLITTTLVKDEPIREEYKGSGGYGSEDDADYIDFMKKIINNEFPVGFYEVNGFADFYVGTVDDSQQDYHIEATIQFKVVDE